MKTCARRAQADALKIEAEAKRRLADEYDAAVDAGEVAGHGAPKGGRGNQYVGKVQDPDLTKPTTADIGLTKQQLSEARQVRNAEKIAPGVVERTVDQMVARGEEPTRAAVMRRERTIHSLV